MFDLRVTSYEEATRLVQAGWASHVVSAMVTPLPEYGEAAHLHVAMDDTIRPSPGDIVPSPAHVRAVLAFTASLTDADHLLVHCRNGVNRSPPLAIAALIQHGTTPRTAFETVAQLRPALVPNRLLLRYVDQQFGLDGALMRLVAEAIARRTQRAFARS